MPRPSSPAKLITGLGVSVPTLLDDGVLSHTAHIQLLQRLKARGASAFLLAGSPADSALSFTERLELSVVSCAAVSGTPIVITLPRTVSDNQLSALTGFATSVLIPGNINMTELDLEVLHRRVQACSLGLVLLHRPRVCLVNPSLAPVLSRLNVQVVHDSHEIASLYALRDAGVAVLVGSSYNLLRAGANPAVFSDVAAVNIELVRECIAGDIDAHSTLMSLEARHAANRDVWLRDSASLLVTM